MLLRPAKRWANPAAGRGRWHPIRDLIEALIQVKDPLTLAAFFSAVLLLAFRTRKVPEMFFGLLKEKLSKERFAQVLHRFMVLGFSSLCVLCAVAVAGQILAHKTQAQALSLQDLRRELANIRTSDDKATAALNSYAEGLARINAGQIAEAIEALKRSVDQVPTLTAQYTLAYLYEKQGDHQRSKEYAVKASTLAQTRGDSLAEVRLERVASGQAENKPPSTSSRVYYSGSFDGSTLNREWKIVNPDPAKWTMQPRNKSVMIITQKGPCFNMKDSKNLLLLDKQLPADDFEVIVKASAQLQGVGNQIAMILFSDEANYFWMPLQFELGTYTGIHVYFQKIFQGRQTGSFTSGSSNHVYFKIERYGNDYSGYFANPELEKPVNVDQIQWTRLGTLPWIHFQPKLAFCAVNAFAPPTYTGLGEPPEVAAEFYSVLIRKR